MSNQTMAQQLAMLVVDFMAAVLRATQVMVSFFLVLPGQNPILSIAVIFLPMMEVEFLSAPQIPTLELVNLSATPG
jgi:hypothetical protein